jgi:hypothetical protein
VATIATAPAGTTQAVVLGDGWLVAAFEHHQAPLSFWPGGQRVEAIVRAAGGDLAGGSLEEWQAAMAHTGAALLAAGFFVVPGASA